MKYVALLFLFIQIILLLNAMINLLWRVKFQVLPGSVHQLISIIIPVRNEENNIAVILSDIKKITNCQLEIIVVDDASDDNTVNVVKTCIDNDRRIQLIQIEQKPDNWFGKNYACYSGAKVAKGEYLLFVDADVRLSTASVLSALSYLIKSKSHLLSVFPVQLFRNNEVAKVVPLMNYILLSLLPLPFVRYAPFSSMSAANGQFMLFRTSTYKSIEPHKQFCSSRVEDIQIARYMKRKKMNIACVAAQDDVYCNMYDSKEEALNGFSKNVAEFFGGSHLLALAFWGFNFIGWLVFVVSAQWLWFVFYLMLVLLSRVLISIVSRQNVWINCKLHFVQLYYLGVLILKSIYNNKNKRFEWKGRNVY
ncbi:MAG: glycosyltransferase [Paludibacter sp.]